MTVKARQIPRLFGSSETCLPTKSSDAEKFPSTKQIHMPQAVISHRICSIKQGHFYSVEVSLD